VYLPRIVGGHDIPGQKSREELLELLIEKVPSEYFRMVDIMATETMYSGVIDLLAKRMATGNTTRNLVDPMQYLLADQYAEFAMSQFQHKKFAEFKQEMLDAGKPADRARDVMRFINKRNYIGYHGIVADMDRLTALRISFVVAAGRIDLNEVRISRERLPSPLEVFMRFLDHERKIFSSSFKYDELKPSYESFKRFRRLFFSKDFGNVVLRQKQLWFPKNVLFDTLNGMTVPLPYRKPEFVMGSEEDEDVSVMDGYVAKVISLRRI
jgi:hypothetical protein